MSDPTPRPNPRRWRRALAAAGDLAIAGWLWGWAGHIRLAWFDAVRLSNDWNLFLRQGNEIALGGPRIAEPTFMYTSIPSFVLGAFIRVFQEPMLVLQAWALFGALVAPLTYAVIRVGGGGPLAGAAAGVVMALAPWDIQAVVGIKTPYVVSTFSALAAMGVALGARRHPAGPPLLIGAAAIAVGIQVGMWPVSFVACALAGFHVLRLRGRRRWQSGAAVLAAGAPVLGAVLWLDMERLLGEIAHHQANPWGPQKGQPTDLDGSWEGIQASLIWAQEGMASTPESYRALAWAWAIGAGALALRLLVRGAWQLHRARRGDSAALGPPDRSLRASATGLQIGILCAAGIAPYADMLWATGYGEQHHYPPFLTLMASSAALMAAGVAPLGHWPTRWVLGAIPVAIWARAAWFAYAPTALRPLYGGTFPITMAITEAVRADAKALDREPLFFSRISERGQQAVFEARTVSELVRLAWRTETLEPACYLLDFRPLAGADARVIYESERPARALMAFDDCADLSALQEQVCKRQVWTRRRIREKSGEDHYPEASVLPCARWHP